MNQRFTSATTFRRNSAFLLAIWLGAASTAHSALLYSVGQPEVIYKASQRQNLGLGSWIDGSLGVVPLGNGQYDFYGANSTTPVRTTGTLENPGQGKKKVSINGVPGGSFNYVAGGPIYTDPASGSRLMLYHAERHAASNRDYYTVLGMAISTDPNGLQFQDLGVIVEPNVPMNQRPHSIDMGGGSLTVLGDQLYVHFRDYLSDGTSSELAVARAPLASVLSNALAGQGAAFTKYYNGDWSESAIGGRSSPLEVGNPGNSWSAVSYNNYLNGMVMVSSQWEPGGGGDLYMSTSSDGITWTPRQPIATDFGEQFYPSLIGTGLDPTRTDQSFYVYYTDSAAGGWNRWSDAKLVRRQIMFDPPPPPPPPPPAPGWSRIASYREELQAGGPAAGWKYQWSASGKIGDASKYAPLLWSDAAGVYNTTGGPGQAPGPKTHPDDYLFLGAGAGHPGRSKYYAITGYTIQAEDGAGLYRLINSSIMKADGTNAKSEDGLDVLVYVNNHKMGSTLSVPTTGSAVNFDRDLGSLSIGDTVYVMIGSGKNNDYDLFVGFDYALEKFIVSSSPPPPLPPPPPPPPVDFVWAAVSDYRDDFKPGGPARGWNYLWSAQGKVGKNAAYAPLKWSDVAGVYNSTGGATQTYTGKSHVDDYLSLGAEGGHPGRSKYYAIASYTIQDDDGAGLYRLLTSSIMKNDGAKAKSEDGLEVLVFVNTLQIGSKTSVSTDGQFAGFDRELGALNVGDTIYVMIGAGKNNDYDSFVNFDFTIEKWTAVATLAPANAAGIQSVPEPDSAVVLACLLPALVNRAKFKKYGRHHS